MAGYQRFVYYIYSYDNGEKRTNVGFLRIEVRNGICKMTIQIRALSQTQPLKIYLFKRARQQLNCYEIGSLPIRSGMGNITLNYTMDELAKASLSLTELGGMILFSSREKFYATTWDDGSILVDEMVIINGDKEKTSIEDNAKEAENGDSKQGSQTAESENAGQGGQTAAGKTAKTGGQMTAGEADKHEEAAPADTDKQEESISIGTDNQEKVVSAGTDKREKAASADTDNRKEAAPAGTDNREGTVPAKEAGMPAKPNETSDTGIRNEVPKEVLPQSQRTEPPAQDVEMQCFSEDTAAEYASRILSTYPKMYPFEGDDIIDCVRIELQDIHELPIEHWPLAHNSFLMQGYYSYLHLIFALIKKTDGKKSYVIGIPGICHAKQHYLAGLFGFRQFMPLRMTKDINGEFGYWVYELSKISA